MKSQKPKDVNLKPYGMWADEDYEAAILEETRMAFNKSVNNPKIRELMNKIYSKKNEKDMTLEEKELLIKDLSGRIPYRHNFWLQVKEFDEDAPSNRRMLTKYIDDIYTGWIVECKPYLRPISSMTEEEKEELRDTYAWLYSEYPFDVEDEDEDDVGCHPEPSTETYDWYNMKMFDYRGLISMGLALEAPEGMYNKLKQERYDARRKRLNN